MNPPLPRNGAAATPLSAMTALAAMAAALVVAGIAGCAALPAAELALPPALQQTTAEPVHGLGGRRSGRLELAGPAGLVGRFERQADRLDLFGALALDRVRAELHADFDDGRSRLLVCRGGQTELTPGLLGADLRPWSVECRVPGDAAATLSLRGRSAAAGTRAERHGNWRLADGELLELRSLHHWQGSPLPSGAPVGYAISRHGRVLGAIELNGRSPRLWRPAPGAELREEVGLALATLALLWDPAS